MNPINIKTPAELLAMATRTAQGTKELNAKTTVASGAVTGGPVPPRPTTTPPATEVPT